MKEVKIEKMDELIVRLNSFPSHFVYRGHADSSWELSSGLERVIGRKWCDKEVDKFESYSLGEFCSKFEIYRSSEQRPTSLLSWLAAMQHYGVPTRLLDFTESPYIALYFALEDYSPLRRNDFSIYAIDYREIMRLSIEYIKKSGAEFDEGKLKVRGCQDGLFEEIIDKNKFDVLWVTEPNELNARIDRQSGTFLISGNRGKKVMEIVNSDLYKGCELVKLNVSGELYEAVFALLKKVGINSKTIYGDLEGLGRSIKMVMQVYSV